MVLISKFQYTKKYSIVFMSLVISSTMSNLGAEVLTSDTSQVSIKTIQQQQQQYSDERREQQKMEKPKVEIKLDTKDYHPKKTIKDITNDVNDQSGTCFTIKNLHLIGYGAEYFRFVLTPYKKGNESIIGKCANIDDINQLISKVQNKIIDEGYVTTRVVIADQNLKKGDLKLSVIPGYIDQIKLNIDSSEASFFSEKAHDKKNLPNLQSAAPMRKGDLLNLRDIEQTLENFKKVPSAEANFSIAPSGKITDAGYSDILIDWKQKKPLRISASLDDSGQEDTGKYQGTATFSLDNIGMHNDTLTLSLGHNLDGAFDNKDNDSWNYNLSHTFPFGYQSYSISHGGNAYNQTVIGAFEKYVYTGKTFNNSFSMTHLAHRDRNSKTSLKASISNKHQRNFIDDTEVEVQHRITSDINAGIAYEHSFGNTKLESELMYKKGISAFGAMLAPEESFNEGKTRAAVLTGNININIPLRFGKHQVDYESRLKGQYALEPLLAGNRFSVGSRYTVRGFQRGLSGEHGLLWQQKATTNIGNTNQHVYAGIDVGYVKMDDPEKDELLPANHLVGSVVGVKGKIDVLNTNYDAFAGYAIDQPDSFGKKELTSGVNLNWQFD